MNLGEALKRFLKKEGTKKPTIAATGSRRYALPSNADGHISPSANDAKSGEGDRREEARRYPETLTPEDVERLIAS